MKKCDGNLVNIEPQIDESLMKVDESRDDENPFSSKNIENWLFCGLLKFSLVPLGPPDPVCIFFGVEKWVKIEILAFFSRCSYFQHLILSGNDIWHMFDKFLEFVGVYVTFSGRYSTF